ncbi:MAG: GNAT family N-acetyltransferase [Streptosporangiales bacterium]|nr:GNAT family N-acetyltransferase [Streptosporangiales bacterium]
MRIAGVPAAGYGDIPFDEEPRPIEAVLFDFSGTLFHAVDDTEWIRLAAGPGRSFGDDELARLVGELESAWRRPEVRAAQEGRDLSVEAHRQAGLTWVRAVPELAPLAGGLYGVLTSPEGWVPFEDSGRVLTELRRRGIPVGVVSNIAWDLRPIFRHHGLEHLVDVFVHSHDFAVTKPDPTLYAMACAKLGADPRNTLMVGDTPAADGGAAYSGLRAYVLPITGVTARRRGLADVLRLLGPAPVRLTVRPAEPHELPVAGAIAEGAYRHEGYLDGDEEYAVELRDAASRAERSEVLVAVSDGAIVGTVTYCPAGTAHAQIAGPGEAEFRMLGVAPIARGRNVGERMVHACLERARAAGAHTLRLSSYVKMHPAHALYERVGFRRTPDRDWSEGDFHLITYAMAL